MGKTTGDKHGEKLLYDPKWKGPLNGRSCTDCFCLIIFLGFIVAWAGMGYYAYMYGDIEALLIPNDSEGRRCGIDAQVADKEYLYFFNPAKCLNVLSVINGCDTPQVCVKECPTDYFIWDDEILHSKDLTTLSNKMLCKLGTDMIDTTNEKLKQYIDNETCARFYLKSKPLSPGIKLCIPEARIPSQFKNFLKENTSFVSIIKLFDNNTEVDQVLRQLQGTITNIIDDIKTTKWDILSILGCSVVVSLLYILLLRWFATPIVFVSIVAVSGLLGYVTYRFYLLYAPDHSTVWLVLAIICVVLLAIILLVCIFLRNRIRLACQLIGEASKAVLNTTSTLVFPIVPWVLQLAVLAYALFIGLCVHSLKTPTYSVRLGGDCVCDKDSGYKNGTACLPEVFNSSCSENNSFCISGECFLSGRTHLSYSKYLHGFNIFGMLWLTFFASAFGEMVMAGVFATWYWTFRKSDIPFFTLTSSFWRTLRYHVGTLAFGSFILTICRLIRWVFEYIDEKLKKYDNELVKFLMKCMKCCFWLLEKFLKFINKNAYIMCSIHGKGFFPSARDAFNLLMRNIIRVFVLNKITEWLMFLGKILVTGLISWGAWLYLNYQFSNKITYLPVPVTLIAIGTYLIASVVFSVYSMAVDTLFLCFLEDSERNDGTPEKPYYMSKGLLRILRK